MNLDAPQLEKTDVASSHDGRICQFGLFNRAGGQLQFRLSYRQLPYFASSIQNAAKEMRARLAVNGEAGAADMVAALSAPYAARSSVVARATDGSVVIQFEMTEGGSIAVSVPQADAESLATALLNGDPSAQQN
jgi:hypothetical protein